MHKLSVIICCYNEIGTIASVIAQTQAVDLGAAWTREIIVVDNCSTDGTREYLQQIDDPEIQVVFHEQNMGKGMSIRTGIAHMTGDYMLIQDADLEYDPAEHVRFVLTLQNITRRRCSDHVSLTVRFAPNIGARFLAIAS